MHSLLKINKFFTSLGIVFLLSMILNTNGFCQGGTWTWMHGNVPTSYGIIGVPNITNEPSARYEPAYWTDLDGNYWMFGGSGPGGFLNDLWKYNVSTNIWTWIGGAQLFANPAGVYGTKGVASSNNYPSNRGLGVSNWIDNNGDLWLYGGGQIGGSSILSDLWKYHIATNEWTWVNGTVATNVPAVYGTMGVPSPTITPGAISECKSNWVDSSNNFWLFGGRVGGSSISSNDLWKYNSNTNEWTFMKGSMQSNTNGNYGTMGIENTTNLPPGRWSYSNWKNSNGDFYVFAGNNILSRNDIWRYKPSTNNWTWISGTNIANNAGVSSVNCIPSANDYPCARFENMFATNLGCTDYCFSFGGFTQGGSNKYNDLWMYNINTNKWTWVDGLNTFGAIGNYGTLGVAASTNQIPARGGGAIWQDKQHNIWVFGGLAPSTNNDLWKFTPDASCIPAQSNGSIVVLPMPEDTTLCFGESTTITNFTNSAIITYQPTNGITTNLDTSILTIAPSATTTYTIIAKSDTSVCAKIATIVFTIYVDALPNANFIINPQNADLLSPNFAMTNTSTNALKYEWFYSNTLYANTTNIAFVADAVGKYCFLLKAYNSLGCADSIEKCADVFVQDKLFIPNAFSPNNDGSNNTFHVILKNLEYVNMQIFDRFGSQIFSSTDISKGWDGTFQNLKCDVGTYFYIFTYKKNGIEKKQSGDIMLMR